MQTIDHTKFLDFSAPFEICSSLNVEPVLPQACTLFTPLLKGTCLHELQRNMSQTGTFTMTVVIKNEVSMKSVNFKVEVMGIGRCTFQSFLTKQGTQ